MGKKMIDIRNLTFEYPGTGDEDSFRALDDINIQVEEGEFVVVLGHNGSGKSTLARLINGLLNPTEGQVLVKGMDTSNEDDIWKIRETAGMVFQNPDNQIVATIVEEDVAFGPENLGIPTEEIRKRVDKALEVVEMTEYKSHGPHLLSGGQKQRVAIAGILAMKPDCIIFDEPTAMLDPTGREDVMKTINKLNKEENKTILLITHFMDEAVQADRIIVLEKGKTVLEGTPRDIFKEVKKLKELGLDVPQVTELVYELREEGFDLRPDILSIDELVDIL